MSLSKPEVIYTHESDLDGFVSGLLLQRLAEKLFSARPRLLAFHNQIWKQRPLNEKSDKQSTGQLRLKTEKLQISNQ